MIPRKRVSTGRSLRTLIIIVSGGKTENIYFQNLSPIRADISKKQFVKSSDPGKVLQCAIRYRNEQKTKIRSKNIETWIVIDKDHFDLDSIVTQAEKHNILVAYSNACFELWYALHFSYTTAKNSSQKWIDLCKRGLQVSSYSKTTDYSDKLNKLTKDAIKNAKKLEVFNQGNKTPSSKNPYTSVYKLVERIWEETA